MGKNIFNIPDPNKKMTELIEKANKAAEAYYNGQDEIMTNKEYDDLVSEITELEEETGVVLEDSPNRNVGALPTDGLPKFKHTYPALSLDKTKDVDEFVNKFRKGIQESRSINDRVVLMYKEDGSTVQAYYKAGQLDKLVTRGNGEIGSIITHNASVISGLPTKLPFPGDLVVRGEAVMSYSEFERINSELPDESKYANPRNLAAATLTMLDEKEASKRHLMFQAFDIVYSNKSESSDEPFFDDKSFSKDLDRLSLYWGFNVVPFVAVHVDELKEAMDKFTEEVTKYDYPVDGLVCAMDNRAYAKKLSGTEHHPNVMQGYAFKWADEEKETTLREIEWSPSRTGLLNPVAIFDPVELEGTTVKRASIHNLSIIKKMRLHVGDRVSVFKSNMVIPQISSNLCYNDHTDDEENKLPCCPTCGTQAVINKSAEGVETVYCPNDNCPEKLIGKFVNFCSRDCMNIEGMSEQTISKLVEHGFIKQYSDFFDLENNPAIANIPGFGQISWTKMYQAAERARKTDFVRFITALSIPNIGKGQAKILKSFLTKNYKGLAQRTGLDPNAFNLCVMLSRLGHIGFPFGVVDGFGPVLADGLSKWLKQNFDLDPTGTMSPELLVLGKLIFTDEPESNVVTLSSISGKSFCITGKLEHFSNRQELVSKIESFGGKWADSVSSKTDYLINNDVTSTSGKNKKAKELNIPIISENDFLKLIGG